jgi:hypothetical protein
MGIEHREHQASSGASKEIAPAHSPLLRGIRHRCTLSPKPIVDILEDNTADNDITDNVVLASIGIYGMMAYAVNARTGKIGLRIASGAPPGQVLSRVLGEAFWLTSAGTILGPVAALWLTRFIRVMLYGLGSTDALTILSTAVLLVAASLFAAFAPARRASRVDPIRALLHD